MNQFASNGSSNISKPLKVSSCQRSTNVKYHQLFHPQSYAETISQILNALSNCATNHADRRCQIISIQSLSLVSLSAYAKLHTSTLVFTNREDLVHGRKLEDEICDVVLTMISMIVEEDSDGLSSMATESLGRMVVNNQDNALFHIGINPILNTSRPGPFSPFQSIANLEKLAQHNGSPLEDAHYATPLLELQNRILMSVLPPRIRKIIHRISLFKSYTDKLRTVPFLTRVIVYLMRTERVRKNQKVNSGSGGKIAFAKRWYELDSTILAREFVDYILIPLLQTGYDCGAVCSVDGSVGVSLCALELCTTIGAKTSWFKTLNKLALENLMNVLQFADHNSENLTTCRVTCKNVIAAALVAMRGVPLKDRIHPLIYITELILKIPSLELVPNNVPSAALVLEDGSRKKPTRLGIWIEMALSLILPDKRSLSSLDENERYITTVDMMKIFISSRAVRSVIALKSADDCVEVINAADEMLLVFLSVSYLVGEWMLPHVILETPSLPFDYSVNSSADSAVYSEGRTWVQTSLILLSSFSSCLLWHPMSDNKIDDHDNILQDCTDFSSVVQTNYMQLLSLVLQCTGFLLPSQSLYLNLKSCHCRAPSGISVEAPKLLSSDAVFDDITILRDQILEHATIDDGIQSKTLRISLLVLLSDVWMKCCQITYESNAGMRGATQSDVDENVVHMGEEHVREILTLLTTEISSILDEEKKASSNCEPSSHSSGNIIKDFSIERMRNLSMCIACVEGIARIAHQWVKKFKNSETTNEEENKSYIVSTCIIILDGQGKMDRNCSDSKNKLSALISKCAYAADRIQSFQEKNSTESVDWIQNLSDQTHGVSSSDYIDFIRNKQESFCTMSLQNSGLQSEFHSTSQHLDAHDALLKYNSHELEENFIFSTNTLFCHDRYDYGYLVQLYRQSILHCTELAFWFSRLGTLNNISTDGIKPSTSLTQTPTPSSQSKNAKEFTSRFFNPLRVDILPSPNSRFPCGLDTNGIQAHWPNSVRSVTGGSDPVSLLVAHSIRNLPRYDGEVERSIVITIKLYNITPVVISDSLRLDLNILEENIEDTTMISSNERKFDLCLNDETRTPHITLPAHSFLKVTTTYNNTLNGGDYILWEIVLDSWPIGSYSLHASVTFCDLEIEQITHRNLYLPCNEESCENNIAQVNGKEENDDKKSITSEDSMANKDSNETDMCCSVDVDNDLIDTTLTGFPIPVSPLITLLPCPLVFLRGNNNDEAAFNFLWLSMPHKLPKIDIFFSSDLKKNQVTAKTYEYPNAGHILTENSFLFVSIKKAKLKAWAFSTQCGKILLCISSTSNIYCQDKSSTSSSLFIRGDDITLLRSFFDSNVKCQNFVSNLFPGLSCVKTSIS